MSAWIAAHFWWIDVAIAAGILAAVAAFVAARRMSFLTARLFALGCAVGLMWEIPLSALDGLGVARIFQFLSPPPYPFPVIIVSHTLWDGGLFLAGVALVRALGPGPVFASFSARDLTVLLSWGQLQELGIELLATGTAGWTYVPAAWNPALFAFRGHSITLVPQLMWFAGVLIFYPAALRLRARSAPGATSGAGAGFTA
jgi:hypothetical protein